MKAAKNWKLASLAVVVGMATWTGWADAGVAWEEKFQTNASGNAYADGEVPTSNYAGGGSGADWTVTTVSTNVSATVSTAQGATAPSLHLVDANNTSTDGNSVYARAKFAAAAKPFDMANASDATVRISFDLKVDSLVGIATNTSGARVILSDYNKTQVTVAFGGRTNIDSDGSNDLFFFIGNGNIPLPQASTAIGLKADKTWDTGFDFGTYNTATGTANNSKGAFYRFELTFQAGSATVTGTATNLATNQSASFTHTAAAALSFSNADNATYAESNSIQFQNPHSTALGLLDAYLDNVKVEVVPEPAGLGLLGLGGLLGWRRLR